MSVRCGGFFRPREYELHGAIWRGGACESFGVMGGGEGERRRRDTVRDGQRKEVGRADIVDGGMAERRKGRRGGFETRIVISS